MSRHVELVKACHVLELISVPPERPYDQPARGNSRCSPALSASFDRNGGSQPPR